MLGSGFVRLKLLLSRAILETVKLPLFQSTYKNVDGVELNDANASLYNAYRTETGGIQGFPGLELIKDLGISNIHSIDALYFWKEQDCAIAVCNGAVIKLTYDGATMTATSLGGATLIPDKPVSFASTGAYLLMANGGPILYTDGTAAVAAIADADAPTAVSHVGYIDGYVLAAKVDTGQFYFSEISDPLDWSALDFASAERAPDNTVALYIFQGEIYLLGKDSIEVWHDDGNNPFSPISGGAIEAGCGAPYAVVKDETGIYTIDDRKRFGRLSQRGFEPLSTAYDKVIQAMSSVEGATAYRIVIAGHSFIQWNFPEGNLTLLYNLIKEDWTELGEWVSASGAFDRWIGNNYCYWPKYNLHLVGSRATDEIYRMRPEVATVDSVNPRFHWKTGHLDFGTTKKKRCSAIRMTMKRGHGASSVTEPKLFIRWKDNNRHVSNTHEISLGLAGDTEIVTSIFRTGIFRTRQYEIFGTPGVEIVMRDAEQDLTVMSR